MTKKNILFLCTGNSCRSQMAEGFAKHYKGDQFHFYSAGTAVHGLNERAVITMKGHGIDISTHFSKTLIDLENIQFDYIFTVCSHAHESCPYIKNVKMIHTGFDDPPFLTKDMSDESEILAIYKRVSLDIKKMILDIERLL